MIADPIVILLVEDDPSYAALVKRYLTSSQEARFTVHWVDRLADGIQRVGQSPVDVVLLDLGLPDSDHNETLSRMLAAAGDTPVVVLTTTNDPAQALSAVKAGAQDHLPKPQVNADLLSRAVRYAIERKRSERQLRQLNETLECRVAERSAVAGQRAAMLSRLAAALSQAERRERRRLAHVLHDDLQQIIAAARMRLDMLTIQMEPGKRRDVIQQAVGLLDQAIQASRALSQDLSPPILHEHGLGAGLEWLARRMKDQHGLDVRVTVHGKADRLPDDTASLLLDATRELLFNVVKHARVKQASVIMESLADDAVTVTVVDKGAGFDAANRSMDGARAGFGLLSIRERLEVIGGSMNIQGAPDQGVVVTLRAPCNNAAKPAPSKDLPGAAKV